ncbi:hypothetical protein PF005_g16465 [Phytophthora fragariae]|uniref:Uncharacterized protein n=1 Tax=Phytophthora fragariae TaxID=53985 RepID=A0A6A4CZ35_9STRA|nr:hypothetical protein PF003_g37263 [Phytophthora fragariae]KAE8932122.1 hypothetical protein PF009_g17836 [Phytophthora fragariae]KAE8997488.1 hypothetical protein PF011_g15470 [Phytophthora fragariae]KAE9097049.1 hypothetical protein PF007_g16758 [Phytophthora fragariae]KAE9098037.1 hypothetical protein PF010_g15727 [Phytophthora fragariae]
MIVPTRFGLKYAPIPTLALEYEDDLKVAAEAAGGDLTSLYVHRDGDGVAPTRKLHVVELPLLTRTSETQQITRQLQRDNERFLAPGVVSETQLKRLLDRLVQNLPSSEEVREPTSPELEREDAASESELEESAMEESVMEEGVGETSVAEASRSDEQEAAVSTTLENLNRGAFVSHDAESDEESGSADEAREEAPPAIDTECSHDELEQLDHEIGHDENPLPAEAEREQSEAEEAEDAKKTKALRSESDVSEEDVQSEELEYFSEDGSDEDSF